MAIFLKTLEDHQGCHQLQLGTMYCSLMKVKSSHFQSLDHLINGWKKHRNYQFIIHFIYNSRFQHPRYQPAHSLVGYFVIFSKSHVCVPKINLNYKFIHITHLTENLRYFANIFHLLNFYIPPIHYLFEKKICQVNPTKTSKVV